jgi:hypothetical protein
MNPQAFGRTLGIGGHELGRFPSTQENTTKKTDDIFKPTEHILE